MNYYVFFIGILMSIIYTARLYTDVPNKLNTGILILYARAYYFSQQFCVLGRSAHRLTTLPDKRMALCLNIFFFTRCIFSDIIRLNNLIFQVICRFRHLNSNIISFAMIFFTQNFTKISDDIFGI